jgi:short-subunit dehydrogenase
MKLIVVTGGTKGIGRAILEKFAASGFDVATCSRKPAELDSLRQEFKQKFAVDAFTMRADMSVKNEVKTFSDFVLSLGRSVDVLVNNAGYFVPGEVTSEPEGTLEDMM